MARQQQVPLEIEDQRTYVTKRRRTGEGDDPTIGLHASDARHHLGEVAPVREQLPSVDIVDEVEPTLPVEGHRTRRNPGVQSRHGVLQDIEFLQTGWPVVMVVADAGSIDVTVLRYADEAGGVAIGFEAVDDRPVGDMDATLGACGQIPRKVTAVLRRRDQIDRAIYTLECLLHRRVDLVAGEGGDVVAAVRGGHGADRARLPAGRQRPHRGRQGKPRQVEEAMKPGCHLSCPSVQQRQLVCATVAAITPTPPYPAACGSRRSRPPPPPPAPAAAR